MGILKRAREKGRAGFSVFAARVRVDACIPFNTLPHPDLEAFLFLPTALYLGLRGRIALLAGAAASCNPTASAQFSGRPPASSSPGAAPARAEAPPRFTRVAEDGVSHGEPGWGRNPRFAFAQSHPAQEAQRGECARPSRPGFGLLAVCVLLGRSVGGCSPIRPGLPPSARQLLRLLGVRSRVFGVSSVSQLILKNSTRGPVSNLFTSSQDT